MVRRIIPLRWVCAATLVGAALGVARAAEPRAVRTATAESMAALVDVWARGFAATGASAPVTVVLRARFSAEAFEALLRGEIDVAPFARELFPSERTRFRAAFGHDPLLVPVALGSRATKGGTHAIAVYVADSNPLTRLTMAQLRALLTDAGAFRTWGDLGLGGEWARRSIVVHGMLRRRASGDPPGIVNYLEQRVLRGAPWRADLVEHADIEHGPQALELIVRAVAADPAAIGYSGFAYAQPGTKTVALAETDAGPFYAGSADEVSRATYPLTRQLYLCVDPGVLASRPEVRDFLMFVLGTVGQQPVGETPAHFFPLPPAMAEAARKVLR